MAMIKYLRSPKHFLGYYGTWGFILGGLYILIGIAIVKFKTRIFYLYYVGDILLAICGLLFFCCSWRYYQLNREFKSKLFLIFSALIFSVLIFDLYVLNFRYDTNGPGGYCVTHWNWYRKYVNFNKWGFWEKNVEELSPRPEVFTIAAVGDSFTFGQGLKGKEKRFTELLQQKLNAGCAKKVRVINFGLGGADTLQETEIVRNYASAVKPDVVLLCYLANDIEVAKVFKGRDQFSNLIEIMTAINPTLNFLYWKIWGPSQYQFFGLRYVANLLFAYCQDAAFAKHAADLETFVKEVRRAGAKPVFVILPFPSMWSVVANDMRPIVYGKIKNKITEMKVPIIDLTSLEIDVPLAKFSINGMDSHPNEAMHKIFAAEISKWFNENNVLPKIKDCGGAATP